MILQAVHRGSIWMSCVALLIGCVLHEDEDPAPLSIGPDLDATAECGAAQKFFPLAVDNYPDKKLVISDANVTGGFSLIDPLPVVFAGGEHGAITIRAPLAVVGTDFANNRRTGTLLLVTSEGDRTVALASQIKGANLRITDDANNPLALSFTGAGCPAPITAKITNWGDMGMVFTAPTPVGFRIDGFVSGTIGPGETKTISIRPITTSACSGSEAVTFTASGPLCTLPVVVQASFSLTGSPTCSCP